MYSFLTDAAALLHQKRSMGKKIRESLRPNLFLAFFFLFFYSILNCIISIKAVVVCVPCFGMEFSQIRKGGSLSQPLPTNIFFSRFPSKALFTFLLISSLRHIENSTCKNFLFSVTAFSLSTFVYYLFHTLFKRTN